MTARQAQGSSPVVHHSRGEHLRMRAHHVETPTGPLGPSQDPHTHHQCDEQASTLVVVNLCERNSLMQH